MRVRRTICELTESRTATTDYKRTGEVVANSVRVRAYARVRECACKRVESRARERLIGFIGL